MDHRHYIEKAIEMAVQSVKEGGGPFGAVVASERGVLAHGMNRVAPEQDSSAHAEIQAIRSAGKMYGIEVLDGATLYASCQPCAMCLGAIAWSRIAAVYYAAASRDAEVAGFIEADVHRTVCESSDEIVGTYSRIEHERLHEPFEVWRESANEQY